MEGSVEVGDHGLIGTPVTVISLVLGVKKAYSWIEPGLEFAAGRQQLDSEAEELRVLTRE